MSLRSNHSRLIGSNGASGSPGDVALSAGMCFGSALADGRLHPLDVLRAVEASSLILAKDGRLDAQQGNQRTHLVFARVEKSGRYINATARLLCFFGFVPWFFFILLLTSPIWFTVVLVQGLLGDAGGGAGSNSGGYYKRTDTMLTWANVYKGLYDRYSPSAPAGAVTTGGSVYRGLYSPSTGDNLLVGTVTQDGSVYQGLYSRNQGGLLVGTVTEDGSIYQGLHSTYGGGGLLVGTVTTDGNTYKGIYSRYGGGNQIVGHVEPKVSIKIMGGAALLLLLS